MLTHSRALSVITFVLKILKVIIILIMCSFETDNFVFQIGQRVGPYKF